MMTYTFLQEYWWFIISLLGGLLVFLLFVQGGNTLLIELPADENHRKLIINSTGRKWEFTFTTLVTFGGAFFASFPLFYSTSFGGAYWLWMILLFSFVLQAVSYEFQSKLGNLLGQKTYRTFLVINGFVATLLLGGAVSTFFTGSDFYINKDNLSNQLSPLISTWGNAGHGLDALLNVWNLILGLGVLFLSRVLALLYFKNNIDNEELEKRIRRQLLPNVVAFLIFFLTWFIHILLASGFDVNLDTAVVSLVPNKYLNNLLEMPVVAFIFVLGVVLVLAGIFLTWMNNRFRKGIWLSGIGTVFTVLALFLLVGYNHTAYYPSSTDLQSSLTISNSSSSMFTLEVMFYVSFLVPFVLAYITYCWKKIDGKHLTSEEISADDHAY